MKFLSTPSTRRATVLANAVLICIAISIHALREEGDPPLAHRTETDAAISIHALHEEGDAAGRSPNIHPEPFLSTSSARRATIRRRNAERSQYISIHALREEGDRSCTRCRGRAADFYPRPPRGGRPIKGPDSVRYSIFLSTPSARRATRCPARAPTGRTDFYPRPPRGGRRDAAGVLPWDVRISIRTLCEEGDSKNREKILCFCLIIHLPAQIAKRSL